MPNPSITKQALASCLKELMAKLPLSKISVGDIVAYCGMSRNSFYYHFKDKYDLVNWIFFTDVADIEFLDEDRTRWQSIEEICDFFYKNKAFYMNALSVEGQNTFSEYFNDLLRETVLAGAQDLFQQDEDRQFYATFFTDSIVSALFRWIREGMKTPPEKFALLLQRASAGVAIKFLENSDEQMLREMQ